MPAMAGNVMRVYTGFRGIDDDIRKPNTRDHEEVNPPKGIRFSRITIDELENFPFPKANHMFFPLLREYFKTRADNNAER